MSNPARSRTSPGYAAHPHAEGVDRARLEAELRRRVRGEVRFDRGSRAAYSTDSSNFRQVPIGVVVPRDLDDMVDAVAVCHEFGAPLTNRGGGTSLSGETTNVAVILDSSKYVNRIDELDPVSGHAWCEPGVVNDALREAAGAHGLTFGPDPSTHDRCTIGGNVGNNSCGAHSVMSGRTSDNVVALEVLTHDGLRTTVGSSYSDMEIEGIVRRGGREGSIFAAVRAIRDRYAGEIRRRFPPIPRRVSGYNLDELLPERGFNLAAALTGTEGTCVTVLRAQLRLVPWPAHRSLLVIGYPSIVAAADHVGELMAHRPIAVEGMDRHLMSHMRAKGTHRAALDSLPDGPDYLMVEFGGDTAGEARAGAGRVVDELLGGAGSARAQLVEDPAGAASLWRIRDAALGTAAHVPGRPPAWPGWEDAAVDPLRLGAYLRDLGSLYERFGFTSAAIYGHFGEGCVHSRIPFDFATPEGLRRYRDFLEEASDLVLAHGGSLSGEHGDGQQRAEFLEKMFGPELMRAMLEFKAAWDPDDRMNPGKLVDPVRTFRSDENLRVRSRPASPATHFSFADDEGSLGRAVERCVGVGKCRASAGSVMCPSYQVLREEEHSTRGRARLLQEMLEGDLIADGWRSREVFSALDMCLSCKGCKSDCPTGVDMATYKAEFLSHYYRRRLRPRPAYAMGLVMYAARLGSRVPRLANLALHGPPAAAVRRAAGVHPDRRLPRLAPRSFSRWFRDRAPVNAGRPPVLLMADTFTNHFDVGVAVAVCEVLEAAGYEVRVPEAPVCCARPLFDYGMLRTARRMLARTVDLLDRPGDEAIPVVVPEPSCCASLRDELPGLLPDSAGARRLAGRAVTFAEFMRRHAPDFRLPPLPAPVLVQPHCHQGAVMGTDAEEELLSAMGSEWEAAPAGCCGLAGSWGFERQKYEVSMQCGEQALFPAVRRLDPEAVVVADGFSCRNQIAEGTGRRAVHLAELVRAQLVRAPL